MLSRLLKFVAEMLEDMEGAAFEGTLEQEHISMLSEKKKQKKILKIRRKVITIYYHMSGKVMIEY